MIKRLVNIEGWKVSTFTDALYLSISIFCQTVLNPKGFYNYYLLANRLRLITANMIMLLM